MIDIIIIMIYNQIIIKAYKKNEEKIMKTRASKLVVIILIVLTLISSLFIVGCTNKNDNNLPFKTVKVYSRQEYKSILHTTVYFACADIRNISSDTIEVYMIYDLAGNELKSNTKTLLPEKSATLTVEIPGFEYTKVYPEKVTIMWAKIQ